MEDVSAWPDFLRTSTQRSLRDTPAKIRCRQIAMIGETLPLCNPSLSLLSLGIMSPRHASLRIAFPFLRLRRWRRLRQLFQ